MNPPPLTLEQRRKLSAQRSEIKCRHMARIGAMKCDCTNVAVKMTSTGPVCKRCSDIEHRNSYGFAKEYSGHKQGGYLDAFCVSGGSAMKRAHKPEY